MVKKDWIGLEMLWIETKIGGAPIEDNVREARLRWFGDTRRRSKNTPVTRCKKIDLP